MNKKNSRKTNKRSNRRSNRRSNNRKLKISNKKKSNKKMSTNNHSVDVIDSLNIYTNFLNIRRKTDLELKGKKNPETKKRYTKLEILDEADKKFKNYNIEQLSKKEMFSPVSLKEGKEIFKKHYTNKYGKEEGKKRMNRDKARKKTSALLKPDTPDSYKYRPLQGVNKRGPEAFDMVGVDDGSK